MVCFFFNWIFSFPGLQIYFFFGLICSSPLCPFQGQGKGGSVSHLHMGKKDRVSGEPLFLQPSDYTVQ